MSASDAQMELEQQQLLIEQLKALVRDRDDALQKKEKELQETNSKLSKARLQAKAKVVKKHAQAQDGKKEVEDSQKEMTPDDGSSHDDGAISQQSARAKTLLFKRKLEEKDRLVAEKEEIIRVREGQLEAKERVLAERDVLVNDLTEQLEEKTKAMEKMQGVPGGLGDDKGQVQEMYAQMVYKDRKIMELNAKILEQDKRVMDLQEFAGEKDQVIRGRNKVVEVLQNSIKEKEQAFQDQALLISKLTSRVETTNEKVDEVTEQLRHREQELKSETERFHIKLTESQKYFEEMLKDMDDETKRLRAAIEVKDRELEVRENDLRELISKHERDIETIMNKGNVNRQDHVVQMLENKLRDTNDVLEGKIKVITILQKESAEKEHELTESRDTMRMLKEKLQVMSEQMMLLQANFVDMETQWKEEKIRLENRMKDTAEKHETELSEKDLHLQTLQSTLSQYEAAYNQALEQYSRLQEHYQQAVAGHIDPEHITQVASSLVSNKDQQSEIGRLKNELEDSQRTISQLSLQVKEFESTPKAAVVVEESASKGDTKLLKMKAQMTSKIKSLEKELQELRENSQVTDEAASLKHRVTELEKENMDLHAKLVDFDDNKATLVELRAQIDELQMVVDTVHDQKADLLKELTAANDERLKFKQVVTDLQASRDLQDQSDRVSSQSMEIEALQGDLQTAANRITELEGSKGELELKLAQLQDQKDALEKEKAELLQEIETWKDKAEHERQSSLTLEKEHEELKLEISELTQSLLREQTITKEQKDEINQLLSQLGNLEGQLNEAHKCLNEAKENLKHTEEQKVDVNSALGATTEKAAKLREQVTLLKEEKLLWDEQITTLKSELAAGHSELNSTTEKAANLQEQVAFLKEENVQLQEQITTMKSELSASQTELEATSVQLEALKAEFSGEIEQLQTKNKMLIDELSEKAASLEKVTSELKTVKNESLVLQSSLMESRAYSQELELQVKQLVREIDMIKEGQNEQGKEYTDKLQTLLTQLTELENELSAQQKHSSEQQKLITELSGNLHRKEDEVKSAYESFKDLNQSLGAVQLELSERDGELKAALHSLELEKMAKLKLEEHVAIISGELTHLKDTLSAREQSIRSLEEDKNSSIELTNSALASVKSELESVLEKNSELKSLLECKDSELLTSRQSYDELQDQVAALSSELETSKASVAELLASNEALQAKVASYQDKLAVTSQSFDEDLKHAQHLTESLQEEKKSSKQLIASLEQQLTSLKIELEETLSTSAKKDAQISVLSVALSDQENHQDSLQAASLKLQAEKEQLNQQVLDMTQNLQEAQLQIQAYATAVSEAQQQLRSDEEAKKDLETKVLELTTALSSVESKLQEIEEASKLTGESSKSDLSSLESQLRQMEEQLTAEQQLKVLMEDQLAQVQSDLKAEMESKITLEHLLTDSEDHKAAMEQKLLQLERSLQENIENASKSSSEYEQVIAELREKLTMSDSQIAELSHSLESVRAQNEVSNKILEQMQTSSSEKEQNTIQQLRDKAEEMVILQQQLEQSAVELNEHKTNTVKTENRIGDLEEELLSNKNELQRILSISESLQEELKSKDLKVQQLQNLFEEERVSFSQEKEALTNKIACLEAQGQELSELKQKCLAADEERQVFIEQLAIVQAELETVASLQSQVADLKSQNEMLLGSIETSSDKLTAVQGRCLELEAEKEALSSKVSELTELQEAHQATIQSLSQDKQVLEKDVTQLSETLSSYSAKISELIDSHKILEETREQLNLTQTECQKLRQLVEEKDVVLSQQVSDLLERSQLIDTLTAARDKLMEEIKIVSSTVAEKDQKIQSLLENMQEMEDRLVQLEELSNQQTPSEQQQPSQSANSDSTSAEIEALKAALAEKEKSYADKELMAKKAIATAKKLKFQLTQANKSLEDANKALDNAKTQIMELNVENTTLQTKLAVVSSEVQQSSDVVKELSQEVQKSDGHKPTELSTAESRFEEQQQTKLDTTGLAAESINTELEFSLNVSSAQSFGDVSLEVESLQAQVATYRECCEQLQQQVQDLTEASFANESKLKQKQNLIDQLEGVKEGLKLTVTEVELAYQQLQEQLEKANEDYIASKEAFEKKCEILSEQAQQWKSFTDSLQQEVTVKDHRIQQMEAELHHLHSEHSESVHLKESLREKDNRLAEYSVQLESLKSVLDSESETTEELRRKLSGAEEAIETMRNSLEEKERNLAQSASLLSEMQQRVQEREAEVEALKESLEKQQVDFKATEQDLHSQVTILSDQIEDYKSRVEAVSALLENSQQTQDTMAAQSESLKQQLDQQGAYIDELNGIVDDLKAQVEESRAKLHRENAEELESVRAALVEFQQQVEDQNQVINTLEQSLSKEVKNESEAETAQKSQTSSAESLDDVNLQLLNYQTLVEELNREILALKEVKTQEIEEPLNNDAEYWKANLDQLVLEKTAVEEERNQLKSELDNQLEIARRMQEVVSEKLAQVQNLQNAYEHLQSSLSALSSEKEQLLVNIDYLKGELDGMEQVIAESQFAESKAKDEVSRLKSERDQLIIRVGKLEQELLHVRHQLHKTDSSVSQEAVVTAEKSVKWSDQIAMEKSAIAVEHLQQAADTHPQGTVAQKESLELSLKLETAKENLKQVQGQYEKTKSRLQVAEVKCEKMLVKLKSFKDKNDKLQIQVDELQQKLGLQEGSPKRDSNPREERRRLEEQVTSLNNRLRDVETHNGRLIHDNSTLKEQLKSVEATYSKDRFDEVTTALSRVQSELEDRNAALEFAKSQAQDLQQTVDHLRAELQLKSDEVNHLKAELVHQADSDDMILNEKLMRFQVLLTEKTAEISELKRQLAEEEELQLALNDQVARLQHELELSKKDAEASLISELSKLREVMSKELSALQNEFTVKNNESVMLAQERDSELKLNESLNEELKHMVQEIARLNEELSSEKFRASKAEKEVLDLQQRLSEELKLKDVAEQEKEDLRMTELNSLKNQLETLQFQYDSLSQDNTHYQSLTTSLTTNSSALKREIEELRFKLKKSDEQHQDGAADVGIGKDVFVLTQRLKDTERERDELSEEFEGVREELVSLRREKTALTQQVGDLSNTVQQLHNQISSLQASSAVGEEGAVVAAVKSEQTRVSNKDAFSREQIDVLEGELTDLRDELVTALDTNQQLRHEISGLNWKLEEASNLEQEVEDLQSELSSSAMEKKILSHDLEEVRGEMSALQTDKHLLMKEVERLSELLENQDFHEKDAGDSKTVAALPSIGEEMLQVITAKDSEITEIQGILDLRTDQLTASLKDITAKDKLLIERDHEILALKDELGQLDHVLKDNEDLDQKIVALVEELRAAQVENEALRKKFDNFNQKIDSVKSLEADFDSLNADFNKVLEEKSSMAREIDELHIKIRDLMSLHYETTFTAEQQQHVLREKETLQRRVEELEGTEGSEMEENARLKRELDKISASLQQAEFDNKSLISQLQLAKTEGMSESESHADHKRLQAQFTDVLEQKNAVVNQLNDALHTLKQREARCQQLAMQVSQLAEDRGYLNTQLANISKSLREKEQEWLAMRHQYGDLYQAYIGAQSKNAELERRIALDSVQKELEDEETAAEADQIRGENDQSVKQLEDLQAMYQTLQDSYTSVSTTLIREKTLREQLERELGDAHEQVKLLAAITNQEVHIELDDDSDPRIRETTTMLTRHGFGYCSRVQSWLKVKNRQLGRVMRLRPGLRTVIWIYFAFLHIMLIACFGGFL